MNIFARKNREIKREILLQSPVFLFDVISWPPKEIFVQANNKRHKTCPEDGKRKSAQCEQFVNFSLDTSRSPR